jgi:hypothetical protein
MAFNLNTSSKPDVQILKDNIDEMINIYGVNANFIYTNKMNKDFVLKDFSHFKSEDKPFEIYLLPEDESNWATDMAWDAWGLNNLRTISFFLSSKTYDKISEKYFENSEGTIINSLLIMPNGSILEISDLSFDVEGGNNLFIYPDDKSAYLITARMYNNNEHDDIKTIDNPVTSEKVTKTVNDGLLDIEFNEDEIQEEAFTNLDDYFNALDNNKTEQDDAGQRISNSDSVFGSLG